MTRGGFARGFRHFLAASVLLFLTLTLVQPAQAQTAQAQQPPARAERAEISLPAARDSGAVPVERALKQRRSVRSFAPGALRIEDIAQLCWAAQGITDAKGHRTAPSARATYPLELYVLVGDVTGIPAGIYHYRPDRHDLVRMTAVDPRPEFVSQGVGQDWIATAPATFVLTGVSARTTKGTGDDRFVWVEAGLAAENFFLQAVALGLGSTYVGGFKPDGVRSFLQLPAGEEPLGVLPVGRPK